MLQKIVGIFTLSPFNALLDDLRVNFVSMLRPLNLPRGKVLSVSADDAIIVLEGELDIELEKGVRDKAGAGTFVGVLSLFVPELANHCVLKASADTQCLLVRRQDINRIRTRSPEFDQAYRTLAGERMERLEQKLAHQMEEAVAWARSAAGAIRVGAELADLVVHSAHSEHKASPLAVWLGILLDGIPESLLIGAGLYVVIIHHPAVGSLGIFDVVPFTLIAGLFLSIFPEALSSSANMLAVGMNRKRIFWMWFALMAMTAVGSAFGFLLAGILSEPWLVFAQGVAAGAMLTMITAAMIPDAAAHGHLNLVGLSTLGGLLTAVLFKLFE